MLDINDIINKKFNTTEGIYYFVNKIKEKYPSFNINEDNLKNLLIEEMPLETFEKTGFVGVYYARLNKIALLTNLDNLDYKFTEEELLETFLHELIHTLTSKIEDNIIIEGLNQRMLDTNTNSYFLAINEGITQYIVNDLLGSKSDAYPFETTIAEQLSVIIGKEKLIELYTTNNLEGFINSLKTIDPELDERSFVINIAAVSLILNDYLDLDQSIEAEMRVTNIQKQLIELYNKSNCNKDLEFNEIVFDSSKASEILNQSMLKAKNPNLTIDEVGFKGIDELKNEFNNMVKRKESEKMDYVVYDNKKEEIFAYAKEHVESMVKLISDGQVIKDVVDSDGERIIVTLTERGTYGYQAVKAYETEPHYYAESTFLIEDLLKNTDSDGRGLRYISAKSRIQRNLVGVFSEYILDRGHHSFYVSQKSPKDSDIKISQRMTGYDRQDPVSIFCAHFDNKKLFIAADAQYVESEYGPTVRVGVCDIKEDGSLDYDQQLKMAKEAEMAKRFLGESYMTNQKLNEVIEESNREAQALFFDVYKSLGIPMQPNVEPNYLLSDQAKAILPDNPNNQQKLN